MAPTFESRGPECLVADHYLLEIRNCAGQSNELLVTQHIEAWAEFGVSGDLPLRFKVA